MYTGRSVDWLLLAMPMRQNQKLCSNRTSESLWSCTGTGHTTMTCPHRIRQDHNFAASSGGKETLLSNLLERESSGR